MFVQEPLSLLEWLDPPEIRKMFSENYLDFVFVLLLRASVIRAWACACANERRVFGGRANFRTPLQQVAQWKS